MLSFGSASMLWWSLAAVIPFVLHLWNRKPKQVVPFAATRFLVAATKRQSKRIKFQQWILLLTRVAILLLLALALAEPRWGRSGTSLPITAVTHHLLVVDDSYSMLTKIDGQSRLEVAKVRLSEMVRAAPPGDLFSLITMGEPCEVLIAGPSHDREEIERAIKSIEGREVSAQVAPAISVVRRLIEEGEATSTTPRAYRVAITSDVAKNTWGEVSPEQVDKQLTDAAPNCSWNLIPVGDVAPAANLTISDFAAASSVSYVGQVISGVVTLANTGATEVENAVLEIRVGDRSLFREEVTLAAGQQQSIPWKISPQRESVQLTARIDSDDLEVDNRRYLSIEIRAAPRVLCLASSEEAARHVVLALTSGPVETRPRVDVFDDLTITISKPPAKLADYDAVILLNLPEPQGNFASALNEYVEAGGGVLIGLGDRSVRNEATSASGLYPAELGPVIRLEAPRIDPLDYKHPLMSAFRDAPEVGLLALPVWRYFKLDKIHPDAKVAARIGAGDALLLEESLGRGRVVMFSGSLGAESIDTSETPPTPWSGLPGSAAFVPLVQELVMRCAAGDAIPERFVGNALPSTGELSADTAWEYAQGEGWQTVGHVGEFPRSGFYRPKLKEGIQTPISVNIDARESWFTSDRERFGSQITTKANEAVTAAPVIGKATYRSLSAWLLIPLALIVCGEIMLAAVMRRGGRAPAMRGGRAT